ncbi:hypothetical protein [Halobiforma nitratireducens]|uniref:Uncharacterized protein n=1 Tax=Halobiforma nitratireducens JCM 10879 TaxID=1227454 RepID=M0M4Z6_9EURY|nr:hypothetical protein [Halobiforma nitratireducens]EMA39699.1 hypothetical protein C446_08216 [Halobiforma nitratireducens JCM 10879]
MPPSSEPSDADPVTLEVSGTTLRATDIAGHTVTFDITGWDELTPTDELTTPTDVSVTGRVSKIEHDLTNVLSLDRLDGEIECSAFETDEMDCPRIEPIDDFSVTVPTGEYVCRLGKPMEVRIRFDGTATISGNGTGSLTISFAHPTAVTLGFTSFVDFPRHGLTVEPTTGGIATALSHFSSSIETTSAERVHRNYRGYPPMVDFGTETHVPEPVRDATPDTGIDFVVPDRFSSLFIAAPLAYYLGASVSTGDLVRPLLEAPEHGVEYEFDPDRFAADATALLRRVFFFDFFASLDQVDPSTITAYEALTDAGIDIDIDVDVDGDDPIAARLAAYLEAPDDSVEDVLPGWPYRVTVEPTADYARTIPHLLYDMAVIESEPTATPTATATPTPTDSSETNVVSNVGDHADPDSASDLEFDHGPHAAGEPSSAQSLLDCRRIRGTLGDAPAPDEPHAGFTALPSAYDHRLTDLERATDDRSVAVVFADETLSESDRSSIVDRYRRRTETVSPTVSRLDDPTRDDLAECFTRGVDFLHYVGECGDREIACRDGYLSVDALECNEVGIVQLDAPATVSVAEQLVRTGSIAGVARTGTGTESIERPSTTIGELLLYGHCVATASACAAAETGRQTAVVGDGAYRYAPKWYPSNLNTIRSSTDDGLEVTSVPFPVDPVGVYWNESCFDGKRLLPSPTEYKIEPAELTEFVSEINKPLYYDDRFYWMDEQWQLTYPLR